MTKNLNSVVRWLITLALATILITVIHYAFYWNSTQPIGVIKTGLSDTVLVALPQKNRMLISFIEANGKSIAPTYEETVCTEFLIEVLEHFTSLSGREKKRIRIITDTDLNKLLAGDSSIIKGIQYALENKGEPVNEFEVLAGDLVQFWNIFNGKAYGHCGIVREAAPEHSRLIVYSSHPLTHGYGIQEFRWPDKTFFIRLK